MNGYFDSRRILLPRVRARVLCLTIMSTLALAACGGGGGGGSDDNSSGGGTPPPPANQAPTVNAGTDKTGNFPEPVSLTGTATDPENNTLTYTWSKQAGPGDVAFSAGNALATNVTVTAPGNYTLRLSVSDGTNTVTDDVAVSIPALFPAAGSMSWTAVTPAAAGLDEAKLDAAISASLVEARDFPNTTTSDNGGSGMIIRYGKLVKSWGDPDQTYELKSTTKSIGGIALLLALDTPSLNLTLNSPARSPRLDIFGTPPANTDANRNAVTVGQLATHTAGFEKQDQVTASNNDGAFSYTPGTTWFYSDAGLNWLADVLTVTFDRDLRDLLREKVFTKLGIANAALSWRDSQLRTTTITNPVTNAISNRRELSSGISGSVDAMARIGLLFLRKGKWGPNDTDQIISETSVALVSTPQSAATATTNPDQTNFANAQAHYGVLWWTNKDGAIPHLPTDAYWAWGLGESLIVVIPSLDMVVVRAGVPDQNGSSTPRAWNVGWNGDYSVLAPFLSPIGEAAGQ